MRIFHALVLIFAVANTFAGAGADHGHKHVNSTMVAYRVFSALDKIEVGINAAVGWTKSHRKLAKSIFGIILVLYGGQFSNTMLFIHSFWIAGAPMIGESVEELAKTYKAARDCLKKEIPEIIEAKKYVFNLRVQIVKRCEDIRDAKKDFDSGTISKAQYELRSSTTKAVLNELEISLEKINAASSLISHLKAAINPAHLQGIAMGLIHTMMMGVAAVSSQAIGTVTEGLHMGKVIFDRGLSKFESFAVTHHNAGVDAVSGFVHTHPQWVRSDLKGHKLL